MAADPDYGDWRCDSSAGKISAANSLEYVMKVYGIRNCDTVKKARAWLDDHGIEYEFVDFKRTPPSAEEICRWCHALDVNVVLNRRGTT